MAKQPRDSFQGRKSSDATLGAGEVLGCYDDTHLTASVRTASIFVDGAKVPLTTTEDFLPGDPANPHNWPTHKRWLQTLVPSGIALVATFASSVFTPGFASAQAELHTSREMVRLAFAIFVLGLAVGAPFASPASETFGRKNVYLVSTPAFALFILGTGLSQHIATLCVTRFFAGIFASTSLAIGSGSISDIWPPAQRSLPMTIYVTTPYFGPALGPLVGGYVVVATGTWRWTSWLVLIFTAFFCAPLPLLSETYKSKILARRAHRLSVPGPTTSTTGLCRTAALKKHLTSTLARPLHMLGTEPVVMAFSLYIAFNFALNYSFFASYPYIYSHLYGYDIEEIGLTFLGVGAGCIASFPAILIIDRLSYGRRAALAVRTGSIPPRPEHRLYMAMVGAPFITISLFMFGWTAQNRVHWLAPVAAEALFGFGNQLVFMASTLYVMDFYGPLYGASAMGANTMLRYVLGCVFPLFTVYMYEALGVGWASSLLGFVSLFGTAVPFLLYFGGPWLRQKSQYARDT